MEVNKAGRKQSPNEAVDEAAYGKDGESGVFGTLKSGVSRAFSPVKGAVEGVSAAVRDGVSKLANKIAAAIGPEPAAPGGVAGSGKPGAAAQPAAAATPAAGPAEKPGMLVRAWAWITGKADGAATAVQNKADAAMANVQKVAGKVDAVTKDVGQVQDDLAGRLEKINKAHDTFMAGVDTVRAVQEGDVRRAMRSGSVVMEAAGYTDMGAGMRTVARKADQAEALDQALRQGDTGDALVAAGEFAALQDVTAAGQKVQAARRTRQALQTGDTAYAVYEAGRFLGSRETEDAGERMFELDEAKRASERQDQAAALIHLGRAAGSRAIESSGDTLSDVERAREYAEAGETGNAISAAGRAAGDRDMMDVGDRVDAGQEASRALQGKDRYGNSLGGTDAMARFLGNAGRATKSRHLEKGGRMVVAADAMNQAMDAGDEASAQRAAADLMREADRKRAAANLDRHADELDQRFYQANLLGGAAQDGRMGDLVDGLGAARGMKAQTLEPGKDAKEFEERARKSGEALAKVEQLGKKLTGKGLNPTGSL